MNSEDILSGIVNSVPIVITGGVFSLILYLSARGIWGKFLRTVASKNHEAQYDEMVKESDEMSDNENKKLQALRDKFKNLKSQNKEISKDSNTKYKNSKGKTNNKDKNEDSCEVHKPLTWKDFLFSAIVLVVGILLFCIFYYANVNQEKKIANPNCIETTAELMPVQVNETDKYVLKYVYWVFDEETNEKVGYIFEDASKIKGVNDKEGDTIKIYYSKHNPEISWHKTNSSLLLSLGIICITFAIIVALFNLIFLKDSAISIGMGAIFFLFMYGLLFYVADLKNMSLVTILFSGFTAYVSVLLGIFGIMLIINGIYILIKRISSLFVRGKESNE